MREGRIGKRTPEELLVIHPGRTVTLLNKLKVPFSSDYHACRELQVS
jgi:hypothetical protein